MAAPGRLTRRAEFQRAAAKGRKAPMPGLVLQALPRDDAGPARLGFTVTKKIGNAVIRNRTRRRLKEAARLVLAEHPVAGVDLVLIGRAGTADARFRRARRTIVRRALAQGGRGMTPGCPHRRRRRPRLPMDDPPGDRRQLPLPAELQRLRDRRVPHPWGAARQRAGGAAHPALQPMARGRLRPGARLRAAGAGR